MAEWSVRAELDVGQDVDDDTIVAIRDHLDAHSAAVGEGPEPGRLSIQMHVDASTIRKGFEQAARAITDAARACGLAAEIVDARIMTDEEFEREQLRPTLPPLMGVAEIAQFLGVSRQRVGQLVREHPAYFHEVVRVASGPLYAEAAVRSYAARGRTPGRPRKAGAGTESA